MRDFALEVMVKNHLARRSLPCLEIKSMYLIMRGTSNKVSGVEASATSSYH